MIKKSKNNFQLYLLFLGNGISRFGTSLFLISSFLYLSALEYGSIYLGIFQALSVIPAILLVKIIGPIIDRYSRKSILIITDVMQGSLMIFLAISVLTNFAPLIFLFVLSFLSGIANTLFLASVQSMLGDLEGSLNLHQRNSWRSASSQLFNFLGNGLAPVILVVLSFPFILIINGISFFLSALGEIPIRERQPVTDTRNTPSPWIKAFVLNLKARKLLSVILFYYCFMLLSSYLIIALPGILEQMELDSIYLGFAFALLLLGAFMFYLFSSSFSKTNNSGFKLYIIPQILILLGLLIPNFFLSTITLGIGLFLLGGGIAGYYLAITTGFQKNLESKTRGKAFSLFESINAGIQTLSFVLGGLLLDFFKGFEFELLLFSGIPILFSLVLARLNGAKKWFNFQRVDPALNQPLLQTNSIPSQE